MWRGKRSSKQIRTGRDLFRKSGPRLSDVQKNVENADNELTFASSRLSMYAQEEYNDCDSRLRTASGYIEDPEGQCRRCWSPPRQTASLSDVQVVSQLGERAGHDGAKLVDVPMIVVGRMMSTLVTLVEALTWVARSVEYTTS
jgi:hypothetical protein